MNTQSKSILFLGFFSLAAFIVATRFLAVPDEQSKQILDDSVIQEIIITALAPDVSVNSVPKNDGGWEVVPDAMQVGDGDGVRTSADGRAIITHEAEIITSLNSNTEIILALNENQKETRLELLTGQTWSKLERALEQDEVYEVYTPTMVAAVRGTSFGVTVGVSESLIVSEGVVSVSLRDSETGEAVPGTAVEVSAGEIVEVIDGELVIRDATEEDYDGWYREHNDVETNTEETAVESTTPETVPTTAPANDTTPAVSPNVPEPEPQPEPQPEPETVEPIDIGDVRPTEFYLEDEDYVLIEGDGLDRVTVVYFDGHSVEFQVTNSGSLAVRTTEIDGPGEYDVEISDGDNSVEFEGAFLVLEPEPEEEPYELRLDRMIESSSEVGVVLFGIGFLEVDNVSVNNDPVEFDIISDSEIELPSTFFQEVFEVSVSGNGETDSLTVVQ